MNDWITEQLALCDAATRGPWRLMGIYDGSRTVCQMRSHSRLLCINAEDEALPAGYDATEENGRLLASARTNYPAALRMLRVAVEALDAPLKHLYHSPVCAFDKAHGEGPPVPLDAANCLRCHLAKALEEIKEIGGAQ